MKRLWKFLFGDSQLQKEIEFELRRAGMLTFQIELFNSMNENKVSHPNIMKAISEAQEKCEEKFMKKKQLN